MFRRSAVWLCSLLLPVLLLAGLSALPARGTGVAAPAVIINEWSQGESGRREWIELLTTAGPLDMRGWDLGDSSPGDLVFADHPLWQAVPTGTLIVVYNAGERDLILPPDDADNGDGLLILPHDASYFAGGWPALANSDPADNPHLRDSSGSTVHDFSAAPGVIRHPDAQEATFYLHNTVADIAIAAYWANASPAETASPGAGNTLTNSHWIMTLRGEPPPPLTDLHLEKAGPLTATVGSTLTYRLELRNEGALTATTVLLTDTFSAGLTFAAENSGLPLSRPAPGVLVWEVTELAPAHSLAWTVTATVRVSAFGSLTNSARVTSPMAEMDWRDNQAQAVTLVAGEPAPVAVLVDAVFYDGYEYQEPDEAVRLRNVGTTTARLDGWQLGDGGAGVATFPPGTLLPPAETMWVTRDAQAFQRQFGFLPALSFGSAWPGFANGGDEVLLSRPDGKIVDALVYKDGTGEQPWWDGPPLLPYTVPYVFPEEGQVLYRRLDQRSGLPVADSNRERDWAQTRGDSIDGRKVQYPGWSLDPFFFTGRVTETARLTVAIAPDNAYELVAGELDRARESVHLESLTFENLSLAAALVRAARRGVTVTVLLEGAPVGGLADAERYVCQQLEAAGGACWFMIRDDGQYIQDRYRYLHAKFVLVDGRLVIVSSENMSPNSLPDDDKADGTWGRRGVLLATDATAVVDRFRQIFADDFAPDEHHDLYRWQAGDPEFGAPPPWYIPVTTTGGTTYTVQFSQPVPFSGTFAFEVLQAPENSLRTQDGLLGLLQRAGKGDVVLVQQLSERPHWGPVASTPQRDPNPRLEAYLDAARRGARVRLLLDDFFDKSTSAVGNTATCAYVADVARRENLNLRCQLANPTGLGIHNKMVLIQLDGRGWVHVGSLNGTEQAAKGNREVALQVQSDGAYELLASMFSRDWPHRLFLPLFFCRYSGPVDHVVISEVLYDPIGLDGAEFVELANPTPRPVDLSGWRLGDAADPDDFEDMRRFPDGTVLAPHSPLVVAFSTPAFREAFGRLPDFEIYPSDPFIPDLIDDPEWGDPAAWLQLGNSGDEVLLFDAGGRLVDLLVYGAGVYQDVIPAPLVGAANHSLERYPYWVDSDNCAADFREWPLPDPGNLP